MQVRKKVPAYKLLNFMGNFLFSGNRLERFVNDSLRSISLTDTIDGGYLKLHGDRNSKIFGIFNSNDDPIAGLIIKYYPWERLKKQLFFNPTMNENEEVKTLSVESIASIIDKKLSPQEQIQLGIHLSYFTVKEEMRSKGVGRSLFQKFIDEVQSNPEKCKLAFIIALGKYSKIPLGENVMKHVLEDGLGKDAQEIKFPDILNRLNLPKDLFEMDVRVYPTKILSKEFGFTFLGFSKYLGELWGKVFEN